MEKGKTPNTSMLTKVFYSKTKTGERTQLCYVQTINPFKTLKKSINYGALDLEKERQAKGIAEAQDLEIPFLYTEEQWDNMKAIADSDDEYYWFFQLPEATASTAGKPLTFYFTASADISMDTIEIDNMLQSIAKLFISSDVEESKGFPTTE